MFPGSSPRRQSVGYPGYTGGPGAGVQSGYDYSGVTGPGHTYGVADSQQWPGPGYHHLYSRYDDWGHHAASAAAAVAAASHFQPPSPGPVTHAASNEADPGSGGLGLYGNYVKPSPLVPPVGDFKPPLHGDPRSISSLEQEQTGGEADPLRSQQSVITGGRAHHSPDSGLAASDGVSGSDSPSHSQPQQPPSPGLNHDLGLLSRPQPARSPYEWMKRPSVAARTCKEGTDGRTRTKDKYRVVYSDHQRLELEKEFHYSRYITIRRKAELAQALTLSERQVKIWFQNRRAKERKQVKKRDEFITKDKIDVGGIAVHHSHMAAMSVAGFAALGPMGHMMHHPQHLSHL